jgi:hypothetical protein
MKKGLVVGLSIMALIGFCIAIFYQIAHIDEPVVKKSIVSRRTNIVDFFKVAVSDEDTTLTENLEIEDEYTPLASGIEDEVPGDGNRVNNSNPNAKKEIESSQIISFYCTFSTLYEEGVLTMGKKQWKLRADYDGTTVRGSYLAYDSSTKDERRFEAGKAFMDYLMDIIDTYDLASYNGLDNEIRGISDEYGATLSVMFESGENIYASDNEENFLPLEAEDAFVQLFASACAKGSDLIGLSVSSQYEDVTLREGKGHILFPLLHIGRMDAFGKINELKYPVEEELREAINNINCFEMDMAMAAKDSFENGRKGRELYYESESFVTRNDSEVISLYIREKRQIDLDQTEESVSYRTYNVDSVTGNILLFSDVFRDLNQLPNLIDSSLKAMYPRKKFFEESSDRIRKSIMEGNGDVCFSLANGFVHIFINAGVVDDEPEGYHLSLSFEDNPKLISNFYGQCPDKTFTRLDYDTDYYVKGGIKFRMECDINEDDVKWRGTAGGRTFEAPFYGYAPDVYLTSTKDGSFLYVNVPTGDVSFYGMVYEITDKGLRIPEDNGDLGLSILPETTLDPDYVLMHVNEVIDGPVCFMYPTGAYMIDNDGFPVPAAKEYKLSGGKLKIRESGRYNPRNSSDALSSGGMFYVAEGTEVTPYASDLQNYIDFITVGEEESRTIRFVINEFSPNMKLDNFGGLDKVFE